mmetsp:Transcript_11537/g.15584  ORF Transcript_11537/g.15584 Transcript_11537/m.15584 type:complete len:157 (+) Transcript_11537:1788-2258(+)
MSFANSGAMPAEASYQEMERTGSRGGLVPNRNSFYNGQNALLQTGRHMEFSKVASTHSLLGKVSSQPELQRESCAEASVDESPRTLGSANYIEGDCTIPILQEKEQVDSAASQQDESPDYAENEVDEHAYHLEIDQERYDGEVDELMPQMHFGAIG